MIPQAFLRTDLAVENENVAERRPSAGVFYEENTLDDVTVLRVRITSSEGEKAIGRPIGTYITLSFDNLWDRSDRTPDTVESALTNALESLLGNGIDASRLLVVGLGNRAITADAIGPFVSDRIEVTGHWEKESALLPSLPRRLLFSISPGVIGKTGIETLEQVKAAIAASRATCVLAVDSLASRSVDRLCRTIQLADSGIVPGSGVGNHRAALNQKTLGVPVIAIGIPSIVSSSTLILEAMEKAGISELSPALTPILENGRNFFVTLKDCDLAAELLANLTAHAVNRLAHPA